ncbi:phosphatidylinositol-glycan biosynthesis class X protein [Thalassophryne amazonica]|uniref:phosphatidylinositol-glycan biosynthesis class X protein n=1 Tax=Thalassophryne amazonica TaxID=390379 RepID=UPI00147188F3|nr:phosphatidylinositol-glycan biosynthesis class X protein [Thalassophryne amazonica]
MYFLLFSVLACFSMCCCVTPKEKNENFCDLLKSWYGSTLLSVEISRKGFHGEVTTTVDLSPYALSGPRVLLIHRWPRGLYVDPYQLASLSDQSEWRVLLDSVVDLEGPAHKNFGLDTLIYVTSGQISRFLNIAIPVHGRYHEPSHGERFVSVNVELPELLLQAGKYAQQCSLEPHSVVDAPCTADNSSMCQWVKIHHQRGPGLESFKFPVGDKSLVMPVCSGTFLITMLCCAVLSKYLWRHRII